MSTTPENTTGTSIRHGIYGLLDEFRSRPRPEKPSKLRLWIEQNEAMLVAEAERAQAAGEGPVTEFELTPEVLAKVYRGPLPLDEFMDLLVETDSPYTVEIRAAQAAIS